MSWIKGFSFLSYFKFLFLLVSWIIMIHQVSTPDAKKYVTSGITLEL